MKSDLRVYLLQTTCCVEERNSTKEGKLSSIRCWKTDWRVILFCSKLYPVKSVWVPCFVVLIQHFSLMTKVSDVDKENLCEQICSDVSSKSSRGEWARLASRAVESLEREVTELNALSCVKVSWAWSFFVAKRSVHIFELARTFRWDKTFFLYIYAFREHATPWNSYTSQRRFSALLAVFVVVFLCGTLKRCHALVLAHSSFFRCCVASILAVGFCGGCEETRPATGNCTKTMLLSEESSKVEIDSWVCLVATVHQCQLQNFINQLIKQRSTATCDSLRTNNRKILWMPQNVRYTHARRRDMCNNWIVEIYESL